MDNLSSLLSPVIVDLENLLLDPNNPRFSELGEELNSVAENRFADPKVQSNTFDKMRDQRFDVNELRDTIKTLGFLPMDRIVVRPWKVASDPAKYVVIEGNRRVTALRWLVQLHDNGKETFTDERLKNLQRLECLVLDDKLAPASATLANAKRYAREMGIWYMDGYTLASYIAKLGLSEFVYSLPDEDPVAELVAI